jgi:hypothetical protein
MAIHTYIIEKFLKLRLHLFKLILNFQLQSLEILNKDMIYMHCLKNAGRTILKLNIRYTIKKVR